MDSLLNFSIEKISSLVSEYMQTICNIEKKKLDMYVKLSLLEYAISLCDKTYSYALQKQTKKIDELLGFDLQYSDIYNNKSNIVELVQEHPGEVPNAFRMAVLLDNKRWNNGEREISIAELFIETYYKVGREIIDIDSSEFYNCLY